MCMHACMCVCLCTVEGGLSLWYSSVWYRCHEVSLLLYTEQGQDIDLDVKRDSGFHNFWNKIWKTSSPTHQQKCVYVHMGVCVCMYGDENKIILNSKIVHSPVKGSMAMNIEY